MDCMLIFIRFQIMYVKAKANLLIAYVWWP